MPAGVRLAEPMSRITVALEFAAQGVAMDPQLGGGLGKIAVAPLDGLSQVEQLKGAQRVAQGQAAIHEHTGGAADGIGQFSQPLTARNEGGWAHLTSTRLPTCIASLERMTFAVDQWSPAVSTPSSPMARRGRPGTGLSMKTVRMVPGVT